MKRTFGREYIPPSLFIQSDCWSSSMINIFSFIRDFQIIFNWLLRLSGTDWVMVIPEHRQLSYTSWSIKDSTNLRLHSLSSDFMFLVICAVVNPIQSVNTCFSEQEQQASIDWIDAIEMVKTRMGNRFLQSTISKLTKVGGVRSPRQRQCSLTCNYLLDK